MKDIDNLCMNCFSELTEGAVCAECGHDNDTPNDFTYLAAKTVLEDKYVVGAVIRHESDAVTYAGYDLAAEKRILIREFYPKGMASRLEGSRELHIRQKYLSDFPKYKKAFFELWTTLEKMRNLSAVVPVYDVFEANGTVCAVIEYQDAIPLREYLLRNENGYITWDTARLMFMPVLTTIEALHTNGFIHGSITPDSLMLCRDGKVRLSPFCLQQCGDITSDFEFSANDSYAALEQYENSHKICPATDIYSFAACIYRALVGTNPPPAVSREANDKLMIPNSIAETIPMHVIKAMGSGLQIYPDKRVKTISDFRELLDAAPSVRAQSAAVDELHYQNRDKTPYDYHRYIEDEQRQNQRSRAVVIVLAVLIILAIGAGIWVVKFSPFANKPQQTTTTQFAAKTYQVPNFSNNGYTQSDIENNGAWNDQFTIRFTADYSTDVEEGIIFKQSVKAGETVDEGTEIILTVSKGIQTETVPAVGGLTLDEATEKLEELGFKVTTREIYNDGSHTPDTVKTISGTAPQEGKVVAVGEEIIVQVYGEAQTTTTQPQTDGEDTDGD